MLSISKIRQSLIFPGSETQGRQIKIPPEFQDSLEGPIDTDNGNRIFLLSGEALSNDKQPSQTWLLYFYGNAMCLSDANFDLNYFRQFGLNVVIPEYIGFGMSSGTASESGCYETARAAYQYLTQTKGVQPDQIIVAGWSLGAAVATYLAKIQPVAALILLSAFTNIPDEAVEIFPNVLKWLIPKWLIELLIPERFNNLKRIAKVKCPIFISHGTEDEIVPFAMAKALRAKAKAKGIAVSFLPIPRAKHNEFFEVGGEQLREGVTNFIANLPHSY